MGFRHGLAAFGTWFRMHFRTHLLRHGRRIELFWAFWGVSGFTFGLGGLAHGLAGRDADEDPVLGWFIYSRLPK